jgi:hypothetical protein
MRPWGKTKMLFPDLKINHMRPDPNVRRQSLRTSAAFAISLIEESRYTPTHTTARSRCVISSSKLCPRGFRSQPALSLFSSLFRRQ